MTTGGTAGAPAGAATARWLVGFGVICALALGGEVLVQSLGLPLPGATVGMLVLLGVLLAPGGARVSAALTPSADALIVVLPLLLVPLAVGVMGSVDVLAANTGPIVVALVVGWLATFATATVLMRLVRRRRR